MAMKWYPYGHDFGNSETCDVLIKNGKQLKANAPTAFVRVDPQTMRNVGVDLDGDPSSDQDITSHLIIQLDGEPFAFAVGQLALAQGVPVWSGRGDDDRYSSRYNIRAILALSSRLIPDKEYGLYIVGGLPADIFMKNGDLRKQIKQSLDGLYRFSMDDGKTWRTCAIEVANVIMEGAGALLAYNRNGQTIPKEADAAIIDIGGGTTDLYAQKGQTPMREYCGSARIAVETAISMLCLAFEHKYRSIAQDEARAILRASVSTAKKKPYPKLSANGKEITAEEQEALVKPILTQVGEDIASYVASTWRSSGGASRFNPVVLIGGGHYYFAEIMKKKIPHLEFAEDPSNANALGYATLASKLLLRKQQQTKASTAAEGPTTAPANVGVNVGETVGSHAQE